jgi:transposase
VVVVARSACPCTVTDTGVDAGPWCPGRADPLGGEPDAQGDGLARGGAGRRGEAGAGAGAGAGKPFKVVLVAAMRKLLTILNAMLKENRPWDESRLQSG